MFFIKPISNIRPIAQAKIYSSSNNIISYPNGVAFFLPFYLFTFK